MDLYNLLTTHATLFSIDLICHGVFRHQPLGTRERNFEIGRIFGCKIHETFHLVTSKDSVSCNYSDYGSSFMNMSNR